MQALISANIDALEQLLALIEIAPDKWYKNVPEGMTSAVGRHVRHVLDHYTALQSGMADGEIDYDQRNRDSVIEADPVLALEQIKGLIAWLRISIRLDAPIKMKTEISMSCQESRIVDSTLQRELIYLLNHTVHHVAYITLVLRTLGINIASYIGVAPATQSYLRSSAG